ncbi:DUF1810 domain-containing protein [Ramlibacter algicola]|uniref:DUF1810 domain-containing protein n=1 Tax=Ramlibacter algicola TaxID=2795217 RepID=A0A934Q3S8_9BURK|nr:DUF1810 domain-containing protein [Ramlibacter algicola]MBK0394056.1 DUF1810 domain-containing protein [Ramlibacter algicola]
MEREDGLDRFVAAQDGVMADAVQELREGRKRTHWMWFVFPQLAGLGSSPTAQRYAIRSLDEARAYLAHPVLGHRLRECCELLLEAPTSDAHAIFGSPDDMKLRSCLTLFSAVAPAEPLFRDVLARFYAGAPDARTLQLLGSAA